MYVLIHNIMYEGASIDEHDTMEEVFEHLSRSSYDYDDVTVYSVNEEILDIENRVEAYQLYKVSARDQILAKLTPEERAILGL